MRPLAGIALLGLVAMTSWVRSEPSLRDEGHIRFTSLAFDDSEPLTEALAIRNLWRISAVRPHFGGYSALLALPQGRFIAFSDKGYSLTFDLAARNDAIMQAVEPAPAKADQFQDIESATRDPRSGEIWLGYESINAIRRLDADGRAEAMARPAVFANWSDNSGPEAMARLDDGRFIILRETNEEGLLFAGDPAAGVQAERFIFRPPLGYQPTDMAQLPDGRVLILVRGLDFALPPFKARLVVADPAELQIGEEWPWHLLADLNGPLPRENYEALAVTTGGDGAWRIWIMSDDNSAILQRTLFAELRWDPEMEKGAAARPGAPSK